MSTDNKIYKRIVTKKLVDGVTQRTFTLVPVIAKEKTRLTKEKVLAAKSNKVYISTGVHKNISKKPVERDADGNTIPSKIWSERSLAALKAYRQIKSKLDAETTETITLPNGFKKKIHIKREFKALPSMKLSSVEREEKLNTHRAITKVAKTEAKKKIVAFKPLTNVVYSTMKDGSKVIVLEPYKKENHSDSIAKRKAKQALFLEKHYKQIQAIQSMLQEKVHIKKVVKSTKVLPYPKVTAAANISSTKMQDAVRKIADTNRDPNAVHVFAVNKNDRIPKIGMPIAA